MNVIPLLSLLSANATAANVAVRTAAVADKGLAVFAVLHVRPRAGDAVVLVTAGTAALRDFASELFAGYTFDAEKAFLLVEFLCKVHHDLFEVTNFFADLLIDFLEQIVNAVDPRVVFEVSSSQGVLAFWTGLLDQLA